MRFFASARPIHSVLIANRGEIALRIMRTCKRLGLRTIAVYSDADADLPHAKAADEAIRIGPAPARASYLDMDAILAAARRSGADAIHPGYGFLSENGAFVRRCDEAGLIFVGPSASVVEKMGSKIEAKRIAETAGVPVVPGYHGSVQDLAGLADAARRIGFPILVKASAGGGGRGMRRVDRAEEFEAALAAAKAEALAAFGDETVLLEKHILDPRHLEVQLAGDRHGGLVHLFERDCSVQRNNQKILEEAPAPDLPDEVRSKLYDRTLRLGRAIAYDSVGTVEFIMEAGGDNPCFLEMNTRLQVEHPVTELTTGVDLVEWQLLAAAGERLPLAQKHIRRRGHAIEARLTAERADRAFQPVTGGLSLVTAPRGLRFDSGVEAGSQVGLHYDSLLAKLIAHGANREQARSRLASGLVELTVLGVATTQAFLRDAVRHPLFAAGKATTRFLEKAFPDGWSPAADELRRLRAAACVAWAAPQTAEDAHEWVSPWRRRSAVRMAAAVRPARLPLHVADDYGEIDAELQVGREVIAVELDGARIEFPRAATGESAVPGVALRRHAASLAIARDGLAISVVVRPRIDLPRTDGQFGRAENVLEAPLHGVVSKLYVSVGDRVAKGTPLVQMEAMKLIHTLSAPVGGRIQSIHRTEGETVPAGAVLVEISPEEEER